MKATEKQITGYYFRYNIFLSDFVSNMYIAGTNKKGPKKSSTAFFND
ncbi:hypothetical protein SAMN05444274_101369 [Mariniphaga anaerophila]|uniref:Uncharacterized protein n=1 Tax=Mariniphaga anaerophila TaxID=1484053 RepID=A0A1M4TIB5_9BACT|nr:hypothetical protein [Mariniphaga anaerophila]SHE44223.1 hypothetical protein SAMN05444274_101369 [Mariniphaga anaerophila]